MRKLVLSVAALGSVVFAAMLAVGAAATTTVVVTPTNQQGWSTADTRPGGNVTFVADATAPSGAGALRLTTDVTTTAKAQYLHGANTAALGRHRARLLHEAERRLVPRGRALLPGDRVPERRHERLHHARLRALPEPDAGNGRVGRLAAVGRRPGSLLVEPDRRVQ